MFYYLFYNSSFPFIVENRLFSTILYGSILYILTHAILNHCDTPFIQILNQYYWVIFSLDIISFSYSIFKSSNEEYYEDGSNQSNQSNSFNVSFNLLKNKINTLLDRKNDLTITPSTDKPSFQHIRIPSPQSQQQTPQQYQQSQPSYKQSQPSYKQSQEQKLQEFDQSFEEPLFINNSNLSSASTSNKFSTPITQLKKQNNQNNTNQSRQQQSSPTDLRVGFPKSSSSTPISLIREKITVPELTINEDNNEDNNNYEESICGSVMDLNDLNDFEKSL